MPNKCCPSCSSVRLVECLVCKDCGMAVAVHQQYFMDCRCGERVRVNETDEKDKFSYECHACGKSDFLYRQDPTKKSGDANSTQDPM